jgi:MYXO-CTERM domain-containing protein
MRRLASAAIVVGVAWLGLNEPTYDQIYDHWWIANIAAIALIGVGLFGAMRRRAS